jgi:hypothetical protein
MAKVAGISYSSIQRIWLAHGLSSRIWSRRSRSRGTRTSPPRKMFAIALIIFALIVLSIAATAPGSAPRALIWRMIVGALVTTAVVAYAS